MSDSGDERSAVRIVNFEEIAPYLHKCTQKQLLEEMDKHLIALGVANEELHATMQEFMAGQQESVQEIKDIVKEHGDSILVHSVKCPHPENWSRVWKRLDTVEAEQAEMKHDFDVKRLTGENKQDLEIKELMVQAKSAGRLWGVITGGIVSFFFGVVMFIVTEIYSHKP